MKCVMEMASWFLTIIAALVLLALAVEPSPVPSPHYPGPRGFIPYGPVYHPPAGGGIAVLLLSPDYPRYRAPGWNRPRVHAPQAWDRPRVYAPHGWDYTGAGRGRIPSYDQQATYPGQLGVDGDYEGGGYVYGPVAGEEALEYPPYPQADEGGELGVGYDQGISFQGRDEIGGPEVGNDPEDFIRIGHIVPRLGGAVACKAGGCKGASTTKSRVHAKGGAAVKKEEKEDLKEGEVEEGTTERISEGIRSEKKEEKDSKEGVEKEVVTEGDSKEESTESLAEDIAEKTEMKEDEKEMKPDEKEMEENEKELMEKEKKMKEDEKEIIDVEKGMSEIGKTTKDSKKDQEGAGVTEGPEVNKLSVDDEETTVITSKPEVTSDEVEY